MRVLVTWGSKNGGTAGIGSILGEALQGQGFDVEMRAVDDVRELGGFDAVILGGALYANRWVPAARRFVRRHVAALRRVPVWLFSSGPMDDSAERDSIPPTWEVAALAERIGARGHVTFGGRLSHDAKGFPAKQMAEQHAGDWRNPERIRAWATELAQALPGAKPGTAIDHPARSLARLLAHGFVGWAACAATMGVLLGLVGLRAAVIVHAIVAPLVFAGVAAHYFRARGPRDPLPTAVVWTAMVMLLDLAVVAGAFMRSFEMFTSIAGTWLPFASIFAVTWVTGAIMAMAPWELMRREAERKAKAAGGGAAMETKHA